MDVDAPNAGAADIVPKVDVAKQIQQLEVRIQKVDAEIQQVEAEIQQLDAEIQQVTAARRLAKMSADHPNREAVRQAAGDYAGDDEHFLQIELGRIHDYLMSRSGYLKSRSDYVVELQKEKNLLIDRSNAKIVNKQRDFERYQRFDQRLIRSDDSSMLS